MDIIAHLMLVGGRKAFRAAKVVVSNVRKALADERRNRLLIEKEIHHGRYRLSSKNDDDLPAAL